MTSLGFAIFKNNIDMIQYYLNVKQEPLLTKDILKTMDEKTILYLLQHYPIVDTDNLDECLLTLIQNNIGEKVIHTFINTYSYQLKIQYK